MTNDGKTKVTVRIEMKFTVEFSEADGYLGSRDPISAHINKAKTNISSWQWFVKKGALDIVPIQGSSKLVDINIIPGRGY